MLEAKLRLDINLIVFGPGKNSIINILFQLQEAMGRHYLSSCPGLIHILIARKSPGDLAHRTELECDLKLRLYNLYV